MLKVLQSGMPMTSLGRPPRPSLRRPRFMLLTSGLGTGHTRAAEAIARALRVQSPDCVISMMDFWSLLDDDVARAIKQTYLKLVAERPDLYQKLYQLDQGSWRSVLEQRGALPPLLHELSSVIAPIARLESGGEKRHWIDRLLFRQLQGLLSESGPEHQDPLPFLDFWQQATVHRSWLLLEKRLYRHIQRFVPDAMIATQVNIAALGSLVKGRQHLSIPLIGVVTDYGVHDFWRQPRIDAYCMPDESMSSRFLDTAPCNVQVEVTGMPLMPEFSSLPSMSEARRTLLLDQAGSVVLVLGGGLGLGMESVVERLAGADAGHDSTVTFVVLAGRNPSIRARLEQNPATALLMDKGRLRVEPWTDRVALYTRAADIVIGKPGGLTTAEVLACGRPLLSTSSLRGQESFNVAHLENHGVGQLLAEERLNPRVFTLLANKPALERMHARAWNLGKRHGAARVAALAHECAADYYVANARELSLFSSW